MGGAFSRVVSDSCDRVPLTLFILILSSLYIE
jgi:hypothetical protein